jgi:hypothetical protein
MNRILYSFLLLTVGLLVGCNQDQQKVVDQAIQQAGGVVPTTVTIAGGIPATTGTPRVLVNGQAATITGGTSWTYDLPATSGTALVEFQSDGVTVAAKEIKVTVH